MIKELTSQQEKVIRTEIKTLLSQVNDTSETGFKLSIGKKLPKKSLFKRLYQFLGRVAEDSPLQDYLFLDFMTKSSTLAFEVPEKFTKSIFGKGKVNRRRFLQMVGLGTTGFITAVVGDRIFTGSEKVSNCEVLTVDSQGKIIRRVLSKSKFFVENLGNGITLEMVDIPAGSFLMGSPESENGRSSSESPQHIVNVPAFSMGKFEVTQEQYQQIMGKNPSNFKGLKLPVEQVSWNDAVEFCQKLSQKTGRKYRLPSEAEWEYACRAGTTTPFHFGATITSELANYYGTDVYASESKGESRGQTTNVGTFPPNAFGLYDMHGNV